MAKLLISLSLIMAACLLGSQLVGCQKKQVSVIDPLPSPSFDGPVVAGPQPVAAAPTTQKTEPVVAQPRGPATEWAPAAPVNAWRWIVIHHSATPGGSANVFDREHRAKGWDELGYHFVIGNGTMTRDGQIEVGSRWTKQKWGAHARTANQQYNNYGIGVCLVGNFDLDRPTAAQMRSVARLTAHLMRTYKIPASRVIGHGQTKPTDCPGRHCNIAEVRRLAAQYALETDGMPLPAESQAMRGELLHEMSVKSQ